MSIQKIFQGFAFNDVILIIAFFGILILLA